MKYDFSGWATKNDIRCSDGRIIRSGAFKVNDGRKVPLVWNHQHNSSSDVLGHALLKNRKEGVYAYCSFNNTQSGRDAKEAVKHGDVTALSIYANNLQQIGPEVVHGAIREVSLVLAGANPGAFIESVMAHGEPIDEDETEGIVYNDGGIYLQHSNEDYDEDYEEDEDYDEEDYEEDEDYDEEDYEEDDLSHADGGETVGDIFDTLNPKQKKAVAIIIGQAIADSGNRNYEEDDEDMKHNMFNNNSTDNTANVLSHSDIQQIMTDAKNCGSFRQALKDNLGDDVIIHAIPTEGMEAATGKQTYGFNDPSMLFPDYKTLNNPPEWLSRDMDWVKVVMAGVHHTPFSRIKSVYADITEDEARAKGYIKGKQKKEEVFTTLKRTTDPQTVYKKQKMDRDDIIDITDFDVVAWIRAEMRLMLNEEIARAILIGDGRPSDSDDKIQPLHIRPIAEDVPLFNIKVETAATDYADVIDDIIRARKQYKGSGNPTFFTTENVLTEMLLLKDKVGHRLYKTEAELATAIRASRIVTVEPMEGHTIDGKGVIGIIVNLADYNVGTDKGGQIENFEDFDIDFNQYKYLIETRISGALIKPFSALTILGPAASGVSTLSSKSDSNYSSYTSAE